MLKNQTVVWQAEGVSGGGEPTPPIDPTPQAIDGKPQDSQELLQLKNNQARLEKELKGLQSRQDKEKNETQRFLDEIKGHVAKGKTIDEAEQLVAESRKVEAKDDLLVRIAQKLGLEDSPQNVAGNNNNAAKVEVQAILQKYKLDGNDLEVITEVTSKSFSSNTEAELAAANLALRHANKPAPSAGAASAMTTTTQSGGMNEAEASQKYTELSTLLKNPSTNTVKIAQLKKDLTDNGYPL